MIGGKATNISVIICVLFVGGWALKEDHPTKSKGVEIVLGTP